MGGKGSSNFNYTPDPNIGKAAMMQAQLGQQYLTMAQRQYDTQMARQQQQDQIANSVTAQQLEASRETQQWARQDRQRYKSVFEPLQDEYLDDLDTFRSSAYQNMQADRAAATVRSAGEQAKGTAMRQLAARGVTPSSGQAMALERKADTQTALAAAGAENQSRDQSRALAAGAQANAINLGSGAAVNPATSMGLSQSLGSSAIGVTAANNQQAAGAFSTLGSGYTTAMQGYQAQAQALNADKNSSIQAWSAEQQAQAQSSAGFGNMIGTVAGAALMFSSEEFKEDKEPSEGNLAKVRSLPIEDWNYTPESGAGDPNERHTGTYAEDFQEATGRGDGKTIPVIDAIGVTMGAVKELADKVDDLSAQVGRGRGIAGVVPDKKPKPRRPSRGVADLEAV